MAVARVVGFVDGEFVIFQKTSGDVWSVSVPLDLDGEYVIVVRVYDEAGNEVEANEMIFVADPKNMRYELKPLIYGYEVLDHPFGYKVVSVR